MRQTTDRPETNTTSTERQTSWMHGCPLRDNVARFHQPVIHIWALYSMWCVGMGVTCQRHMQTQH